MKPNHITNVLIVFAAFVVTWTHLSTRAEIAALRDELTELKVFHRSFIGALQSSFAPQLTFPAPLANAGGARLKPDVLFDISDDKIVYEGVALEVSALDRHIPASALSDATQAGIRMDSEADYERSGPIVEGLMKFLSSRGVNNITFETKN